MPVTTAFKDEHPEDWSDLAPTDLRSTGRDNT